MSNLKTYFVSFKVAPCSEPDVGSYEKSMFVDVSHTEDWESFEYQRFFIQAALEEASRDGVNDCSIVITSISLL